MVSIAAPLFRGGSSGKSFASCPTCPCLEAVGGGRVSKGTKLEDVMRDAFRGKPALADLLCRRHFQPPRLLCESFGVYSVSQ